MSSEYLGREAFLKGLIAKMSGSDQLLSIEEIERVFELLREVREQGEVSSFSAQVATPSGELGQRDVVALVRLTSWTPAVTTCRSMSINCLSCPVSRAASMRRLKILLGRSLG